MPALLAADFAIQGSAVQLLEGKVGRQIVRVRLIRLAAMRAQATHQALGHHRLDRAGHQERLDAHVGQPRIGTGGVVGVQRAEHQVTGQRRLDGVLGRLQVADFTDQHHVRVVTQDAAQRAGERQPDLRMHLNLVDALQLVFHRIFGRDDLDVRAS